MLDFSSSSSDSSLLSSNSSATSLGKNFDTSSLDFRSFKQASSGGSIYGDAGDDVFDFTAAEKNYSIFAGDGFNTVFTGLGNDKIYSGFGNDIIEAGDGQNLISAGDGVNLIVTGLGKDNISTGLGNDFIDAGDGRNIISAGDGKNRVLTGSGNDLINTGSGNDTVYSGDGNDVINVGNGNNVVNAGTGKDSLTLGSGNDKLILEAGQGSVTVNGFNIETDKLRLGSSLEGKTLTFEVKGADTRISADGDLLAVLKSVTSASPQDLIDTGSLYTYTATDLGNLATTSQTVTVSAINDFEQISGRYTRDEILEYIDPITGLPRTRTVVQPFIWEDGTMTDLTRTGTKIGSSTYGAGDGETVTLFGGGGFVNAIGNSGVIIGAADEVVGRGTDRALYYAPTNDGYNLSIYDFGGVESYFFDINNQNQIAGRHISAERYNQPIYWEDGNITYLTDLGGNGGTARGINRNGDIVGVLDKDGVYDATGGTAVNTAALWQKDENGAYQLTDLGTFGAEQATLRDINAAGQIIGNTTNGTSTTPFIYQEGEFTDLGSLGGTTGSTNGINEFGEIVGASQTADLTNHAYVWIGGQMVDLNSVLTEPLTYEGAVVTLTSAVGINNFGDIIATGTYTYTNAATGLPTTGTRSFLLNIA